MSHQTVEFNGNTDGNVMDEKLVEEKKAPIVDRRRWFMLYLYACTNCISGCVWICFSPLF